MTCKDCIHYELCNFVNKYYHVPFAHATDDCEILKEKSKFIELPCKIGDIITALWDVPTTSKYVPYLAEVKEFRQSKRNGEVICIVRVEPIEYRGRIKEYSVSEFGKLLFFSYDEAAKALKNIMQGV